MQNAIKQLRAHALRDLERFYPSNHYWMRPYSLEADYEITDPLIREPESFRLTGRELAAATAFHNMTFCEMRRRKIYGDAHPVRNIGDTAPSPGVSESHQREIAARHEIFRSSALSYSRLIGEQSLIEAFTPHITSAESVQDEAQAASAGDALGDDAMHALSQLPDIGKLIDSGHFTVLQCSQIFAATKPTGVTPTTISHCYRMAMVDVANQRLNPKHPETFIPYSEYLEMIGAGVFGQDAENFPLPTASWLVTIDDSLEWLASKGLTIDFDTLKAKVELIRGHSRPQTLKVENEQECQAEELGRVSDAPATIREWDIHNLRRLLDESREPGSTHQKLGEQYGVTRQRIGALLKKAKADFSPQRSTTWASSLKIK